MALFGNDYDRDFGYRGRGTGYDWSYRGTPRGNEGWGYTGGNAYDRDFRYTSQPRYGRDYKSRWQTDYGDPFGDRAANTPIRTYRGEYRGYERGGYDAGFRANRSPGYGRDYYQANPAGYEPYQGRDFSGREGTWDRGYSRGYNPSGRGYDAGWF